MRKKDKWTDFEIYAFEKAFSSNEIWELGKESQITEKGKLIGIYKIFNKITNKCYIGASHNIMSRLKGHISQLKLDKHRNKEMQKEYLNNQDEFFSFIIILYCSHSELSKYEKEKLEEYKEQLYNFSELKKWNYGISKLNRRSLGR
jgi:GIY-YIG catalytic domain